MQSEQCTQPVLVVDGLDVNFGTGDSAVEAVRDVSFEISGGEIFGLVGASGSGKSTVARSLIGLNDRDQARTRGSIRFQGQEIGDESKPGFRCVRGSGIGLVPQEALASITPVTRVGKLLEETVSAHTGLDGPDCRRRVIDLLEEVGFDDANAIAGSYAHELSGGMKQRAVIALALAPEPELLIADEPTAALDSISRAQILDLILQIRQDREMTVLLVTHDLGAIRRCADRLGVMDDGRLVETGLTAEVLGNPEHPSTRALTRPLPRPKPGRRHNAEDRKIIELDSVSFRFSDPPDSPTLDDISLGISPGETLALVGGSGSGKTTVARLMVGLLEPGSGSVRFDGTEISGLSQRKLRPFRRRMGLALQDSSSSLNPRHSIGRSVMNALPSEPGSPRRRDNSRATEALRRTGLTDEHFDRFPHQLSGGERQRASLARALVGEPELLICDEPVSGLDGISEGEILLLLRGIADTSGLACLFITHDLKTAGVTSDRVAVMHEGSIVETGSIDEVFSSPRHPHTVELLEASMAPQGARP